ncbi:MAG TPA: acyl carrier protein, partial [Vicinamibacterales bacterium]|nr:acyl carrier protein [Vicinamibacterales bacterium]
VERERSRHRADAGAIEPGARLRRRHAVAAPRPPRNRQCRKTDAPAPRRGFFTIGFDSLTALELRHRLARALAAPLPSTLAFDYPNIHELSEYLAREVLRLDDDASSIEPSSPVATPSAAAASAGAADVDAAVAQALRRLERALGTS